VGFGDLADDRESEAAPSVGAGAGLVEPVEAVKESLPMLGGDAGAFVDDRQPCPTVAPPGGQPNACPDRGVAEGVVDEVRQRAP
jgi:hypothetical protein